ncbi:MAG: hypothetical protein AB1405_14250 [Bdellovibrionota bacterium]
MLELLCQLARGQFGPDELEAEALRLIRSGRVRLVGTFCDKDQTAF